MTTLVDSPVTVSAGGSRAQVLALLRGSGEPLSVAEVAAQTGLHLSTARFHLDGLVEEGLAERASESRRTPGRPRILYTSEGPAPGPRSYGLLAEMLTGIVASFTHSRTAAQEAGRAWGRHLVERAAPSERVDAADAVLRLNGLLERVGFQPESRRTSRGREIRLHHCPFREVAAKHSEVVCALHLGLMQGALSELDAPVEATALEPFVRPDLCVARLRSGSAARPGPSLRGPSHTAMRQKGVHP